MHTECFRITVEGRYLPGNIYAELRVKETVTEMRPGSSGSTMIKYYQVIMLLPKANFQNLLSVIDAAIVFLKL